MKVGDRVNNLMRLIYLRRGFTKENELDVGPKLLDGLLDQPQTAIGPRLREIVDEYYRMMDWDVETGFPTPETISKYGLEEFAAAR
jgi:aldehyde:ferredoxin oxidoreductase